MHNFSYNYEQYHKEKLNLYLSNQKETNKFQAIDSTVYGNIAHEIGGLRHDMNASKIKATNQIREAKNEFLKIYKNYLIKLL